MTRAHHLALCLVLVLARGRRLCISAQFGDIRTLAREHCLGLAVDLDLLGEFGLQLINALNHLDSVSAPIRKPGLVISDGCVVTRADRLALCLVLELALIGQRF